jgi:signal transduction histidine kinase
MKLDITSKIGLLAFILILLTAGIIVFTDYQGASALLIQHEVESTENEIYMEGLKVQSAIDTLREDVLTLASIPPIQGIIRARKNGGTDPKDGSTDAQWRDRLALTFADYLKIKSNYIEAVFLGTADRGKEIVRINREGDSIETVPVDQLQSKEHRTYFQKVIQLAKGEVYLSEVNLRKEKGRVIEPHTPMIRAAVPIFTDEGEVFGFIKINLRMEPLLQSLNHPKDIEDKHYVVNDQGDFLLHPDSSMTFGFDLGTRHTVQDDFPELDPLFSLGGSPDTVTTFYGSGEERQFIFLHKVHFDPFHPERFLGIMDSARHSHVVAQSTMIRNRGIRFALVLVVIGLVIVVFFSRWITHPLRSITQSADAISSGAPHVSLPINSNDEIGSLARSFTTMVAKLKAGKQDLQEAHDQLEVRVAERTAALNRSNQELENFANIASHDLQEPLRKIILFGDRLKDQAIGLNEKEKDYLERMQNAASRMHVFIQDLLEYSKVTSQTQALDSINIRKAIDEVLENLETRIARTNGKVIVDDLPDLEADPRQIRQLFQNLIGNALKYHREGVPPIIHVSGSHNGDELWHIKVKDNGIGFEEKYSERIFKMFERLHGKSAYSGTGIGLAICQKIAHYHHGEITATSKVGEGSTFTVTLPEKQP